MRYRKPGLIGTGRLSGNFFCDDSHLPRQLAAIASVDVTAARIRHLYLKLVRVRQLATKNIDRPLTFLPCGVKATAMAFAAAGVLQVAKESTALHFVSYRNVGHVANVLTIS